MNMVLVEVDGPYCHAMQVSVYNNTSNVVAMENRIQPDN
jgi:hypothetical protein